MVEQRAVNSRVTGSNPVGGVCMTEEEKKMYHEIVEDAIHWYSEFFHCASWLMDIEYQILEKVKTNHKHIKEFRQYQIDAMQKLIENNLWIRWCDRCEGKDKSELYTITGE